MSLSPEKYFAADVRSFWKADFGEHHVYLMLNNGISVAHSEEIKKVIKLLHEEGLPNFGSLILLFAILGPRGEDALNYLSDFADDQLKISNLYNTDETHIFVEGIKFLTLLLENKHIWEAYDEPYDEEDKLHAIYMLFKQNKHNRISKRKSLPIHKYLQELDFSNLYDEEEIFELLESYPAKQALHSFRVCAYLHKLYPNKEALEKCAKGESFENITPEKVDSFMEEQEEENLSFLEDLETNPKTYQIGSLIKRIWGSINLPQSIEKPAGQPFGGRNNLGNKGELENMLMTELAYDEFTFLNRFINKEILYYEPEVPPQEDEKIRVFLIDNTIRNWGNAKTLNFAIAIALANHPKLKTEAQFILVGDRIKKVDLESIQGVVYSNLINSSELTPQKGLEEYFDNLEEKENKEYILLTQTETLQQLNFKQFLASRPQLFKQIITSNYLGIVNVFNHTRSLMTPKTKAYIPMEELWKNQKIRKPKRVPKKQISKPKNINLKSPILLPLQRSSEIIGYKSIYYALQNHCLYSFVIDQQKAYRLIATNLPFSQGSFTMFDSKHESKGLAIAHLNEDKAEFSIYYLKTKEHKSKIISTSDSCWNSQIIYKSGVFSLYKNNQSILLSTESEDLTFPTNENKITLSPSTAEDYIYNIDPNLYKEYRYSVGNKLYDAAIYSYQTILINDRVLHINNMTNEVHWNSKLAGLFTEEEVFEEANQKLYLKRIDHNLPVVSQLIKNEYNIEFNETKGPILLSENLEESYAESKKADLEMKGAVCFLKPGDIVFEDGSRISIEHGILSFESAAKWIPKFYIPYVFDKTKTCFATSNEFAGNTHFYDPEKKLKVITVSLFVKTYLNPFLKHIIDYETKANH